MEPTLSHLGQRELRILAYIALRGGKAWGFIICEDLKLGAGSVHPKLEQLLKSGLIVSRREEARADDLPPRTFYSCSNPHWVLGHMRLYMASVLDEVAQIVQAKYES